MKIVTTCEEWAKIEALGTYERDKVNGEIWTFNDEEYELNRFNLSPNELRELVLFKDN